MKTRTPKAEIRNTLKLFNHEIREKHEKEVVSCISCVSWFDFLEFGPALMFRPQQNRLLIRPLHLDAISLNPGIILQGLVNDTPIEST